MWRHVVRAAWQDDGAPMKKARPIRVLRLTPHFYRDGSLPVAFDPVGGLQIQVWTLTRGLDHSGITQTVVTSYIPGSPRRRLVSPSVEMLAVGPWLPDFLAGPLLCFSWFLGVARLLARDLHSYDLVHIHFNHSIWCRVLAIIVGRTRIPLVVSLNTALWGGLQRALRLEASPFDITRWIERAALRRADRVVALTNGAAAGAKQALGVPGEKLVVIPDAVRAREFQPGMNAEAKRFFRQRYAIPDGCRIVTYIGRISPEKGWPDLPFLAKAFSGGNIFLLICGDGPDRSRLEAAFRRDHLDDGWTVTGFLSRDEIRKAMHLADVLILPSRREVFGSVLLEAMASGIPAVAYGIGGITEVAGEPPAVSLAAGGDRDDLLRRIRTLLEDPIAYESLAMRGRERVGRFSVENSVALTDALYRSLLMPDSVKAGRPFYSAA
jgi:glycosyltransferase involved in cell wall biosynthesis